MAYDYDKMKTAYESLSKEQQRQVAEQNKDNANFQQFAVDYTKERYGTGNTTSTPSTPSTPVETTTTETPATPVVKEETKTEVVETPEVKQEGALKPLSQDYYNQTSTESQEQIVRNLNDYKQSNPEYFKDYESFKKNFSYNARNEEQKNTLDQWYNGYQKGLELSTIPTTDLYTQYNAGQLSTSDLEILRTTNPTKYAELMNQINKGNILAAYDDTSNTGGEMDLKDMAYQMMMQTFQRFMSGESNSAYLQFFDDYKSNMNSPEMMDLLDKTTELEEEATNINDDIASMKKAVEKEYEGTGASRAKINAIIADRTYELQLQLRTVDAEYKKYATQYNNRMQQYQNDFQLQLQQYQLGMQERNQQMSELGFALDLMSFETPEQKSAREWDYWVKQQEYTNGNINSSDYQTRYKAALSSVQNLLSQYNGIPMQRSAEEMAEDILNNMAKNGTTLGEELSLINTQIQGKPEYRQLYNNTYGDTSNIETFTIDGVNYVKYNGQLMTADEFNKNYKNKSQGKWYQSVKEGALSLTNINPREKTLGNFIARNGQGTGGQCGHYVNDYLEYIGSSRLYDDELSTKINSINSYEPKIGTVAVFDYNHKSSDGINHGHVGIVVGVDTVNRTVTIKDSNFKGDEKIQTRTISMDDPSLRGFFDPTKPYGSSSLGTGSNLSDKKSQLSDEDRIRAESILKQIKTGGITNTDISKERDWLINNGYGEEFQEALNKGLALQLTDTQKSLYTTATDDFNNSQLVKDFQKAANQIGNLITSLDANNGVGDLAGIFQFMKVLDPNSTVRESEFENAAKTAGFANPKALYQNYIKHGWDGTYLTEGQRGNFAMLAKEIIKNQAESYNFEYDKMKQTFKNAGIDDQWLPQNYADFILNKLDGGVTTGTSYADSWDADLAKTTGYTGATITLGGTVFDSNWNQIGTVSYETNETDKRKRTNIFSGIPVIGGPRAIR